MNKRIRKQFGFMRASLDKGVTSSATFILVILSLASAAVGQTTAAGIAQSKTIVQQPQAVSRVQEAAVIRQPTEVERETWRKAILHTPRPKKACFKATYPATAWSEVACNTPPHKLYPPKHGSRPFLVGGGGNGADFSSEVTGHVSEGEGSFDSVSGITSEKSNGASNAYSLQLNTEFFPTTTCNTSPAPGSCSGWEQFVYDTSGSGFIQYWMITYGPGGTNCPSGWQSFSFSIGGEVYCVVNAASGAPVPTEPISAMTLTGTVAGATGANDSITVTVGNSVYSAPGDNRFPDLGSHWQKAEFNIFGDGGGDEAVFNTGTTIVVRTSVDSGTMSAPTCDGEGFTGETNNLTLVSTSEVPATTKWPSLVFTESNAAGSTSVGCANAVSIGDTHLITFDGLKFDFQAYGEFVLAQNGPNFQVQTRQAPGPPNYPNTAVNKGVATQMGATRVAVYMDPTRLVINGADNNLADGKTVLLPTGVQVTRLGSMYVMSDDTGNSVRATVQPQWIDVNVGLGHAPMSETRGLLGNPKGNAQVLATAQGVVLKSPVSFTDLYHTYADSWRVQPKDSLFAVQTAVKAGIPLKPFFVSDLDPKVSANALAACRKAGVQDQALLEDCTLDTAVLNNETAAKVFLHTVPVRAVVKPGLNFIQVGPELNKVALK